MLTAFLLSLLCGSHVIKWLRRWQRQGQPIRDDGPEGHFSKKGTPTMGGLIILGSLSISTLLWVDLTNRYVWIVLSVLLSYGVLGFMDDYLKVTKQNTRGVRAKAKLLLQVFVAVMAYYYIQMLEPQNFKGQLALPFFKDALLDLGYFYIVFAAVVIIGASNSVNLTDGLDGLVSVPVIMAAASFGLICYFVGNRIYADYLHIIYVQNAGELAVFCAAMVGALFGFLWYNAHPAEVFMGDTGSLALGGALGTVAVVCKHEIVLAIVGGLFVIEALSVMIQVYSFKTRGVRVFKMAPIHHHFEKLGWPETRVVIRFWIVSIMFALIGLSTLKLR